MQVEVLLRVSVRTMGVDRTQKTEDVLRKKSRTRAGGLRM